MSSAWNTFESGLAQTESRSPIRIIGDAGEKFGRTQPEKLKPDHLRPGANPSEQLTTTLADLTINSHDACAHELVLEVVVAPPSRRRLEFAHTL
jgi:hypothetical protein